MFVQEIIERQLEVDETLTELRILLANVQQRHDDEVVGRAMQARLISANSSRHERQQQPDLRVKLPKIHLPTFDGQAENFEAFWDAFKVLVHERDDIPEVSNLSYLKGQLKSYPLHLIQGLSVTANNYRHAADLLKSTYEDVQLQRDKLKISRPLKGPVYNRTS